MALRSSQSNIMRNVSGRNVYALCWSYERAHFVWSNGKRFYFYMFGFCFPSSQNKVAFTYPVSWSSSGNYIDIVPPFSDDWGSPISISTFKKDILVFITYIEFSCQILDEVCSVVYVAIWSGPSLVKT